VSYANPHKITQALGVILEQSGKTRLTASSKWQKVKIISEINYPKIEINQKLNHF
jgi:hypothetical protein|tara:strand:- start:277 stop:441 length:165 start_codon:yes stop_codon:yes gene_type:complete